jgi:hypothetical protein
MRHYVLLLRMCRRYATKIALTISFGATTLLLLVLPSEAHWYLVLVGFAQNYIWIWET